VKETAREIRKVVAEVSGYLSRMEPGDVSPKENPETWSCKEILGHLIDSAANNHQRIVRAIASPGAVISHSYDQDDWVRAQRYQELEWDRLVVLWSAYNDHLSRVIERIPVEAQTGLCDIGKEAPVSLTFVVADYLRHLRHHLDEILERPTPGTPSR